MARIKLQEITINNFVELESMKEMYYRSTSSVLTSYDGFAYLNRGEGYDFLTYFNSFSIGKWRQYTNAREYYLVIDAKGCFNVDLVGHLSVSEGRQKEWGGRYFFDLNERKEVIIPIPKTMNSKVISFGIIINEQTVIFDAYYATEVDEKLIKKPYLSLLSYIKTVDNSVIKNIDKIRDSLINDSYYKNNIDINVIDENNNVLISDRNIRQINFFDSSRKLKLNQQKSHYILWFDERISFNADSVKRLFMFLSLLKDEYKDKEFDGSIFKAEEKNILMDFVFNKKKIKDYTDTLVKKYPLDMNIWSNVIDNESGMEDSIKRYVPRLFCCIPTVNFDIEKMVSYSEPSEAGYSLFKEPGNIIRLSGVCAWVLNVKEIVDKSKIINQDKTAFVNLQKIITPGLVENEITKYMYYRSDARIKMNESGINVFVNGYHYDFFTYFNALSYEKWRKYTYADDIYLVMEASGHFRLTLFGHYKSKTGYQKEWLGEYEYNLKEKEQVIIPYPRGMQSHLIAFSLYAFHDVKIYNASYVTEVSKKKIQDPRIALVTTTFKKETFVFRNIKLLSDTLLDEEDYVDHFKWFIIDNGRSVVAPDDLNRRISIIPNNNVGGAGGFARGAIEALHDSFAPTHVLFMDDDVVFVSESFRRLCNLLSILREAYADNFISGAMLKTGQPNVQHENTGWMNELGYNEPVNTNFDLNLWNVIIDNEELKDNLPNRYAAFWFCCVPTSICRLDNLPLPVFFRGDDIEYSLRNHAKLITMNGLCIWHEGFEGRFNAFLDYYLTIRNKLMLCAINSSLNAINPIDHIIINFWEEMYKFNYKGASFFLDAIEDFMKGPDFYKNTDGEANMKEKRKLDNHLEPINPEIRAYIKYEKLYTDKYLSEKDLEEYEATHNYQEVNTDELNYQKGQSNQAQEKTERNIIRTSSHNKKKKIGVIPYGWGSWPGNISKMDEVLAVDPANDTYIIYKKSKEDYSKLCARYKAVMELYQFNYDQVKKAYQDNREELTSEKFWKDYLNK